MKILDLPHLPSIKFPKEKSIKKRFAKKKIDGHQVKKRKLTPGMISIDEFPGNTPYGDEVTSSKFSSDFFSIIL